MATKLMTANKFATDGKGGLKKAETTEKPKLEIKQSGGTTGPKAASESSPAVAVMADAAKAEATVHEAVHGTPKRPASNGETAKKLTYDARMRKLAPVVRLRAKLRATILRFGNVAEEVGSWKNAPDLAREARAVLEALESMGDVAKSMPDAFAPERDRRAPAGRVLAKGTLVWIREKVAETYQGIVCNEDGDATEIELTVLDVVKGRVACRAPDGSKVFIPRGHLTVTAGADAEDEDEEDGDEG